MTDSETEFDYSQCAVDLRIAVIQGDTKVINELTYRLEPFMRGVAARVAKGADAQELDEFCGEAMTAIFMPRAKTVPRIVGYDAQVGEFGAWVRTCLSHVWASRKRSTQSRRKREGKTILDVAETGFEFGKEDSVPWYFQETIEIMKYPFTFCDMLFISKWNVRERLELLSLSGLFVRVPQQIWERCVSDYESTMRVKLSRPFPVLAVAECDERHMLTESLCDAIGSRRRAIDKRWSRGQSKLLAIPSMRRVFQQWICVYGKR